MLQLVAYPGDRRLNRLIAGYGVDVVKIAQWECDLIDGTPIGLSKVQR